MTIPACRGLQSVAALHQTDDERRTGCSESCSVPVADRHVEMLQFLEPVRAYIYTVLVMTGTELIQIVYIRRNLLSMVLQHSHH